MKPDKLLTKRKYMHGLQRPKYLWVTFGALELIPEPDIVAEYRINERKLVGELVQQLLIFALGAVAFAIKYCVPGIASKQGREKQLYLLGNPLRY